MTKIRPPRHAARDVTAILAHAVLWLILLALAVVLGWVIGRH